MSKANILVVDDQDSIRHFVGKALEDEGYTVRTAASVRETREAIEHDMPDLLLLDLKLPDGTGIELLREIKRVQPEVPIILMTAFGEVETAVEAMSAGAHWFVKKPFQNDELLALVARALESQRLWLELRRLRHQAFADEDYLHSSSPSMQEAYAIAEQVSRGDNTSVLIEGESGTGKEYFANLIHRMSARHDKPFVEINCAAIPRELLESELFGHEKGAFTDARTQKMGLMELANGGTLFLDEIGEMSPMLQVKLLRVLERRTFKRVGGTKDISVNLRIISATNQDLDRLVKEGGFREDLYYRLKVVPLWVPALRDRREDILPLARLFMERFARQFKKAFQSIAPAAEQLLVGYAWPGNIRELRNLFERTMLLETGAVLEPVHLKLAPRGRASTSVTIGQRIDGILNGSLTDGGVPFEALVEELERALILRASYATNWNQSRTAELLQLKRDKLRYRMKLYEIESEDGAEAPQE
ncbi:MAG: sigma-54-dependent Fis family transcriptional regulator [Candidatus Eisenbacteria bacterium]|uniref:Sigma-54-dependent Fis family transcriptional regulator n=1 Tax=Eiseniibacteriota bacterium TaxID=2212470 RepID=A0A538UAD3_UNCEI|nr:MAG: sigma-54-dependent Fis family transcriptional regulator [Candidatus Eisenbacteria bacterium]